MDQNPANMEHQEDASQNLNQGQEMENVNTSPVNEENVVEETTVSNENSSSEVELPVNEEVFPEMENTPVASSEVSDEEVQLQQIPVEMVEESEEEPEEDFSQLSKQELLEKMEIFSKHDNVNAVKNRINAARDIFQGIVQQEKSLALSKFLEDGGVKEEFDYQDTVETKFFDA